MNDSSRRILALVLAVLTLAVLIDQARFLFTYPVPDTGMWFGDETWTMLTVRAMITSGVARVPEALGSSLAHSNGLINGSIWISAALYGVPAVLAAQRLSPVEIGRVITFLLSLVSLFTMYRFCRFLKLPGSAVLTALFALVISNAFYFSSHSARLDAATGLAVLLLFFLLCTVFDRWQRMGAIGQWAFWLPALGVFSIAVYVHVPALMFLPLLYSLWRFRVFQRRRPFVLAAAGMLTGLLSIVVLYWFSTHSLHLLGTGYNQYYNVANSLPVLHLRSWRVQKINTIDRAIQVWQVAWPLVVLLLAGTGVRVLRRVPFSTSERFFLVNAVLLVLGWGLFGGPAVFYNIHVLPVAAVAGAILIEPAFSQPASRATTWGCTVLFIVLTIMAVLRQERFGAVGARLVRENDAAIHALVDPVASIQHPPLVLTDEPAIDAIAGMNGVRLMTNHLLLFGDENKALPEILRGKNVNYLLLYSTSRWTSPFRRLADSLYTMIAFRVGRLTDQARSYDEPHWNEMDTLRLYTVR